MYYSKIAIQNLSSKVFFSAPDLDFGIDNKNLTRVFWEHNNMFTNVLKLRNLYAQFQIVMKLCPKSDFGENFIDPTVTTDNLSQFLAPNFQGPHFEEL